MSVIEEKWDTEIDLSEWENKSFKNFENTILNICNQVLSVFNEYLHKQKPNLFENNKFSYEEHLQNLIESNKSVKQEIAEKLLDVNKQQSHYKKFKEDQKILTKEIKETHEAFLMAKKYYKKFLKLYYTIESKDSEKQVIFIQFFTESKKDTENYSIRLNREPKTGKYALQEMHPQLKIFRDIQLKLQESNDVPAVLCCIRDAFGSIREGKKLKRIN